MLRKHNRKNIKYLENISIPRGFEPPIFWSVVRRVIRCATGPCFNSDNNLGLSRTVVSKLQENKDISTMHLRIFTFLYNLITTVLDSHKKLCVVKISSCGSTNIESDHKSEEWRFKSLWDLNIFYQYIKKMLKWIDCLICIPNLQN